MNNSIRFPQMLRSPMLRDLDAASATRFIDSCSVRLFDRPTKVLGQGEASDGMYLIADGSVEITCGNNNSQEVLIHVMRRFDVFGEVEALAESPCAATCTASASSSLLFCATPVLREWCQERTFLRNVMKISCERLVRDNTVKFVHQFYPVEQRLREYLFRLSVDKPVISKTQGDLAGLLGCARQTLNRELGRLRELRVIEITKGKIRVLDREALMSLPSSARARSENCRPDAGSLRVKATAEHHNR